MGSMTTDWDDLQIDGHGKLVDVTQWAEPSPPPDMTWTSLELYALTAPKIFGRVVCLSDTRGGFEEWLVIASDLFTDEAGTWVRVVPFARFSEWGRIPPKDRPPTPAPARAVPAKNVWVMHEKPACGSARSNSNAEG